VLSAVIRVFHTNATNADSKDREKMGRIAATYDLMPESTDVPLDDVVKTVKDVLPAGIELLETKIEPVAFGLKKVVIGVIIDDSKEGIGNALDEALQSIPGIENTECTSSTLL